MERALPKGIVMGHLIQQYAESSCGFLSHDEFRSLVRDLPIDLLQSKFVWSLVL